MTNVHTNLGILNIEWKCHCITSLYNDIDNNFEVSMIELIILISNHKIWYKKCTTFSIENLNYFNNSIYTYDINQLW